ncbi:MAG: 30S ribosomal protein S9 [Candidatus Lloydbacteria bacterium]|nr:30S ribosomal protein S9 [Candidatus Lloydbacteria bacterium]
MATKLKKETEKYIETVGRRKTATARVRITPAVKQSVVVNGKPLAEYFKTKELQESVLDALGKAKEIFSVVAQVNGGGITGQAEAVRHGIARALVAHNEELRKKLKRAGYLKRDPRMKERRKFGLKKARKSPQWSKR